MKVFIHEMGDKAKGVSPLIYNMETPFTSEDIGTEELEFFRNNLAGLYNRVSDSKVVIYFDYEVSQPEI